MQLGIHFDRSRCSGCFTCVVACKDWHDIPAGPVSWVRIEIVENGHFPDIFVRFSMKRCRHCEDPPCVEACPAGAIKKRAEDGIVTVDREACLGLNVCGGFCRSVCQYEAPQFSEEFGAKMQKCDLCLDRWSEGKPPICVAACPMRALDAGTVSELELKHPDTNKENR